MTMKILAAIEHKHKYSVGSNPWWQKWPYDHQHERDEHNFKWIHIAKKSHHRHHVGSAEARMQNNQSKKCHFSWYIVDTLCTMFSDLSMRGLMSLSVSVKNMFTLLLPSPLIPWYGQLRKGTNLPGERERAQYNARGKAQRTGLGCKTLRKGLM